MKRLLLLVCVLALFIPTVSNAVPSNDTSGPEGVGQSGQSYFELTFEEDSNPEPGKPPPAPLPFDTYFVHQFNLSEGWDFGDRYGYACAWVEYFEGSNEKFEVHYSVLDGYPFSIKLSDKFGDEIQGTPTNREVDRTDCGGGATNLGRPDAVYNNEDHFPHLIHPGDGLTFYKDGALIKTLDLSVDPCSKFYFTNGDEAGELIGWWDEDGPTFSHGPGEGELPCGGGADEPVAVIRLRVRNVDPDIGYCSHSMHEDLCVNVTPPDATGSSNVSLSDGRTATVDLTVPGFFPPAPAVSCGTGTITLADGRAVDATICA